MAYVLKLGIQMQLRDYDFVICVWETRSILQKPSLCFLLAVVIVLWLNSLRKMCTIFKR